MQAVRQGETARLPSRQAGAPAGVLGVSLGAKAGSEKWEGASVEKVITFELQVKTENPDVIDVMVKLSKALDVTGIRNTLRYRNKRTRSRVEVEMSRDEIYND